MTGNAFQHKILCCFLTVVLKLETNVPGFKNSTKKENEDPLCITAIQGGL